MGNEVEVSEVLLSWVKFNERLAAGKHVFCSNCETWCRTTDFVLYDIEVGVRLLLVQTLGFSVNPLNTELNPICQ